LRTAPAASAKDGFDRLCHAAGATATQRLDDEVTLNWDPKEVTMKTILVGYDETEPEAQGALRRACRPLSQSAE
jgi:hypothetical protein